MEISVVRVLEPIVAYFPNVMNRITFNYVIFASGFLCLSLLHTTYSLRATSLIFSKTTTTTTTTTEAPTVNEAVATATETSTNETVVTRPPLTGIPQIDYKYDPNLPSELNGYNLSDYPFYSRVPPQDEIDFKCDGLHDGFYASIVYKCQVYHHCLYGTRFDFLCANFTAFDQRTFICQFASEVDCANSKNFWHRNDALYIALSTVPPPTKAPVTSAPQSALPGLRRPIAALGGGAGRRRPYRRRRPQYDYYYDDEEYESERERDDYYDDPPRSAGRRRKQRPRTTSRRPETEEYDDYEDERFDRRGTRDRDESRDRSKYDRRGDEDRRYDDRRPASGSKNNDKRVNDDDEERRPAETERRRPSEDRRRPSDDRRKANDDDLNRRPSDDRRKANDDDLNRRPNDDRRKANDDDLNRRPYERPRKPLRDAYDDDDKEDRRSYDRPRKTDETKTDRRPSERPRKDEDDRRYRPKETKPVEEEKIDRRQSNRPRKDDDDRRYRPKEVKEVEVEEKTERRSNRPRKPLDDDIDRFQTKDSKIEERSEDRVRPAEDRIRPTEEAKVLIRPSSGSSVYDRPRAAPIIRRPVPKTERDKFDYKPVVSTKPPRKEIIEDEEYYDDYEDEPKLPPPPKQSRKPVRIDSGNINHGIRAAYSRPRQSQIQSRRPVDEVEEEPRRPAKRPRPEADRIGSGSKNPRVVEEYEDEYEEDKSLPKENSNERSKVTESRDAPAKIERDRIEPVVRVVKRPFLPSRGGNPYSARGLQPVGNKALEANIEDDAPRRDYLDAQNVNKSDLENEATTKSAAETSRRQPLRQEIKVSEEAVYEDEIEEEFKPLTSRPRGDFRYRNDLPRTTQRSKVPEPVRNPLDINENEYDVTLNDALNPTIPNLPVRSVPTGFSSGRDGFTSQSYQRPRLVGIDSAALSPAGSDYVYQIKPRDSPTGQASRYNPYVAVQQLNYRHPSTGAQFYTTFQ